MDLVKAAAYFWFQYNRNIWNSQIHSHTRRVYEVGSRFSHHYDVDDFAMCLWCLYYSLLFSMSALISSNFIRIGGLDTSRTGASIGKTWCVNNNNNCWLRVSVRLR